MFFITDEPNQQYPLDVAYDLRCQSDQLRVTKSTRVYGISHCPVNENSVALVISDSRVLLWQLKTIDYETSGSTSQQMSPLFTPGLAPTHSGDALVQNVVQPKMSLSDMIGQCQNFVPDSQRHSLQRYFNM